MSPTKRSRTTKKKEPAARTSASSARASAAAKAKRTPRRTAAEPVGKTAAEPASVKKTRAKKLTTPQKVVVEPPVQPSLPLFIPPARPPAQPLTKPPAPPPPPPPPPPATRPAASAAYRLDGPVPPEAEGLPPNVGALLGIGQRTLGIKTFRPGQATAFEHLLAHEDLLAVMPTGSGKSLLYQLTSLVVPGVTVVVSPLIALIKDQLDKMVAKGVSACKVDSTLTVKQRREV